MKQNEGVEDHSYWYPQGVAPILRVEGEADIGY